MFDSIIGEQEKNSSTLLSPLVQIEAAPPAASICVFRSVLTGGIPPLACTPSPSPHPASVQFFNRLSAQCDLLRRCSARTFRPMFHVKQCPKKGILFLRALF